jgi:hypothetical protein
MKITTKNVLAVVIVMVSVSASIVFGFALDGGTKSVVLSPGGTDSFRTGALVNKKVSVSARADQGNFQIEVVNDDGRTVASGSKKVNFRMGNKKSKYNIILKNQTNKVQKITVSYTATDDLFK